MTALRTCIGSAKFGIEAHDAPSEDFPVQPSQKDGLGRMCKPHWREYVNALGKAAKARKAADGGVATEAAPTEDEPSVQSQAAARVTTKRAARVAAEPETSPKLPETIAEVGSPEGQDALEAAAKAAQIARRGGRKAEGDPIVEAAVEGIVREAAIAREEASIA